MVQGFLKYEAHGAYHWSASSATPCLRRDLMAAGRYQLVVRRLRRLLAAHSRGVDVGAGDGVMVFEANSVGLACVGLDGSLSGVRAGRRMLAPHGLAENLLVGDALKLPFASASLDFVTCLEVIEHVEDPLLLLREIRRVLRPNGIAALTTPRATSIGAPQDPYHMREFARDELRTLLDSVFHATEISYITPVWLRRLYRGATAVTPLDRSVRLGMRLLAMVGCNPFIRIGVNRKGGDSLLAFAWKQPE